MRLFPIAGVRFGSALVLLALAAACDDNNDGTSAAGGQGGDDSGASSGSGGTNVGGATVEGAGAPGVGGEPSSGPHLEPGARCSTDAECDDGLYCNGRELCLDLDDSDYRVCHVSELQPCIAENCDEAQKQCDCSSAQADADGDGFKAAGCVTGNEEPDCDDGDDERHPGKSEECDPADPTHDEDCKPSTFSGPGDNGDEDGDQRVSSICLNYEPYQLSRRPGEGRRKNGGTDCDDSKQTGARVHPDAEEVCDGLDNDCDGEIDEVPSGTPLSKATRYYLDADGDTFGSSRPEDVLWSLCRVPPPHYVVGTGDCDDTDFYVAPSRGERCNGYDDDCDGLVDRLLDPHALLEGEPYDGGATTYECVALPESGSAEWQVEACPEGRLDCDHEVKSGCEVPATTLCNCHACGNICSFSCGETGCEEIQAASAGDLHTCFLVAETPQQPGRVACAGRNASGQLGDGTYQDRSIAVPVSLPEAITSVSSGGFHSCAVGESGKAYCWGQNQAFQLGAFRDEVRLNLPLEVAPAYRFDPMQGPVVLAAKQITAGLYFTCGLYEQGRVNCWGDGEVGQLGDGAAGPGYREPQPLPVVLQGEPMSGASQVVAGRYHACALVAGAVYCWGRNNAMQLGVPTDVLELSSEAVLVPGLADLQVDEIVAAGSHTCARAGGQVLCWGAKTEPAESDYGPPSIIVLPDAADSLAAGEEFTCALLHSGAVSCWGTTYFGPGGIADTESAPRTVPLTMVRAIAAGQGNHLCSLGVDKSTRCLGPNKWGQLANGTNTSGQILEVRPLRGFQTCSL